jgi:hypothetical protein
MKGSKDFPVQPQADAAYKGFWLPCHVSCYTSCPCGLESDVREGTPSALPSGRSMSQLAIRNPSQYASSYDQLRNPFLPLGPSATNRYIANWSTFDQSKSELSIGIFSPNMVNWPVKTFKSEDEASRPPRNWPASRLRDRNYAMRPQEHCLQIRRGDVTDSADGHLPASRFATSRWRAEGRRQSSQDFFTTFG